MTETQFHHYIPRFILKTFSDYHTLNSSDNEFVADISTITKKSEQDNGNGNGKLKGSSNKNKGRGRGTVRPHSHYINVYQVKSRTIVLTDLAKAFGIVDLYRETSEEDCMKFEKMLSVLERTSSAFIRQIWAGENLSLTRAQLDEFKGFLIIMMYRSERRRDQYYRKNYDVRVAFSARKHAAHHNIKNIRDIWFKNLQWLIETPLADIWKEYDRSFRMEMAEPLTSLADHKWPIHICELQEFGAMAENYICIWEAKEGSEFILSEAGFGVWEGDKGVKFHNFFIVSPKYAIVLVNRGFMFGVTYTHLRKPYFSDKLHADPDVKYLKGSGTQTPSDIFKYTIIKASRQDVFLVNGILLDAASKHLTYKSSVSMYRSLQHYDSVKKEKFDNQRDYTVLKRALFAELNRTHHPC